MKVRTGGLVDAAIRTLDEGERRKVFAWFDHLRNWEGDEYVRKLSKPMPFENTYSLTTSDDFRIVFTLNSVTGEITVMDISRPSRFATVGVKSE